MATEMKKLSESLLRFALKLNVPRRNRKSAWNRFCFQFFSVFVCCVLCCELRNEINVNISQAERNFLFSFSRSRHFVFFFSFSFVLSLSSWLVYYSSANIVAVRCRASNWRWKKKPTEHANRIHCIRLACNSCEHAVYMERRSICACVWHFWMFVDRFWIVFLAFYSFTFDFNWFVSRQRRS